MMVWNSSQQYFRQIPILTNANLLAMINETNRSPPFDPLAEIRNGLNVFIKKNFLLKYLISSSTKSSISLASFSC